MIEPEPITTFAVIDIESPTAEGLFAFAAGRERAAWPLGEPIARSVAVALLAWAGGALMLADTALGVSYFCSPAPTPLGKIRPEGADHDVNASLSIHGLSPFWFDDQSGDYVSYVDGTRGSIERAKVHVPISEPSLASALDFEVRMTFGWDQCVPSALGVLPIGRGTTPQ